MFTSSAMCCSKILFFFFSCIVRIRLNQSQLCLLLATKRTLADLLTMFTSIIQSEKVMADRSHANDICPDWHGLTRSYTWRRDAFQLIFNGKRLSLARRPSLLQKNVKCRGWGGRSTWAKAAVLQWLRSVFLRRGSAPRRGELCANI